MPHTPPPPDFARAAHDVAVTNGFTPEFEQPVLDQLRGIGGPAPNADGVPDLRALPWSSIDNADSLDLDQIEVAERLGDGSIRIQVGIADVDALVAAGSPIDAHAMHNATSLYAGATVFPMLPEKLSTDLTSLAQGKDRLAIVIEVVVAPDGSVTSSNVRRALVRNGAKLAYEDVGGWLEGERSARLDADPTLGAQLRLQDEAARRLKGAREKCGALELDTIEARPVTKDGRVVDLAVDRKGRGRDLIEDFMIAANITIAKFLEAHGASGIRRVVREPERWDRLVTLAAQYGAKLPSEPDSPSLARFLAARRAADPERFPDLSLSVVKLLGPGEYALDRPGKDPGGHFGLAAHDYSHATAPNRRYADLVTQRLVKAVLAKKPAPYTDDQLADVAAHCTEREDAARKVERQMRKIAAAYLLADRVGERFDAIVTGVNKNGTFVRLLHPPAEGRVMRGEHGMDVGDKVAVRLTGTNPQKGFLDFERA